MVVPYNIVMALIGKAWAAQPSWLADARPIGQLVLRGIHQHPILVRGLTIAVIGAAIPLGNTPCVPNERGRQMFWDIHSHRTLGT